MARYGMIVDLSRCIGCATCAMACKIENNLPDGVWWNRILTDGGEGIDMEGGNTGLDIAGGQWPTSLAMDFVPLNCQHCENAPCCEVCPTGASHKDEETGIVLVDADACIGCKSCMNACPYHVRTLVEADPAHAIGFNVGDAQAPAHVEGTVEKCLMCSHRVARGEEPACIAPCPGRARFWGDLDDPNSEVSKLIAEKKPTRLLESEGTAPQVYFLEA